MSFTYGFNAVVYSIRFNADWSQQYTSLENSVLMVTVPDGDTGFLIDQWGYVDQEQLLDSSFTVGTTYGPISDTLGGENPMGLQTVAQGAELTDMLVIDRHVRTGDGQVIGFDMVYLYMDGAPLPYFDTVTAFEAWRDAGTWNWGDATNYPAGSQIFWADFDIDTVIDGTDGNDRLTGTDLGDTINGFDGADTINGGGGDDVIVAGRTTADLRDIVYGGEGNDQIDGGHGNDSLRGDDGDDSIDGGYGADTVVGGTGNDMLSGAPSGDVLFGGDGDDLLNGGFGFDREVGGDGADRFFHVGVLGHGTDWIQDYDGAENDVLVFGNVAATRAQLQVNWATTPNAGDAGVQEALVVYRPTGQIIWALIDGAANDHIWLQIGTQTYDLLAA